MNVELLLETNEILNKAHIWDVNHLMKNLYHKIIDASYWINE